MIDLDINAFYFHSIILGKDESLEVLDQIFKSGKILSLNKGGYDSKTLRMNYRDEVCLSRRSVSNLSVGAYDLFAKKKLSLIVKGTLPGIYKPSIISESDSFKYVEKGKTDLEGEYRVKDEIPLDYVVGLNLPVGFILDSMFGYKYFFSSSEEFRKMKFVSGKNRLKDVVSYYEELNEIMRKNNIFLPIYDIESNMMIESSLDIEKIKKKI